MTLKSLDSYGSDFQLKVISSLLTHKDFLNNIQDVLDPEDFTSSANKWIIGKINEYYQKYHTSPDMQFLKIELKKLTNEVLQISIKDNLKNAYKASKEDLEYVRDEFSEFCRNQKVKTALMDSVDLLKNGEFDTIKTILSDAIKVGQDRNIGHEYKLDVETRYRPDARKPIPFPWKAFNENTQGGMGGGDLVIVFGNPKGGKSWVTIAMACHALKLGYNVNFYALELSEVYVARRFDACLTGIPVDQLDPKHPDYEKNRKIVEETMENLPGNLIIKDYPPKRATIHTIESHMDKCEEKPDMVVIDYLDYLSNKSIRKEKKDELDDVYIDAKGLAKEWNIPVISPSQANRTGAGKAIIEAENIAGSYDKIMVGDIVVSSARTRIDKLQGTARFHFMGNRYGNDGVTYEATDISLTTGYFNVSDEEMSEADLENWDKGSQREIETLERKFLKEEFDKSGI